MMMTIDNDYYATILRAILTRALLCAITGAFFHVYVYIYVRVERPRVVSLFYANFHCGTIISAHII